MLDPTTALAYHAAGTPVQKAQAVRDALGSGTLTVEIFDGATLKFTGTFAGPMVVGPDGSLSKDVLLDGTVASGGNPNAATWTCRITNGSRYIVGSFGPGGRFTSVYGTLIAGQRMRLNVSIAPEPEPQEPPSGDDALSLVLADLPVGQWSQNIAGNTYFSIVERTKSDPDFETYYAAPGQSSVTVTSQRPWSYSSGVYAHGRREYWFTGGGHDDWLGSEVGRFDCRTLLWERTDESAKLHFSEQDPTVPFQSTSNFFAWRNPSGRFAPIASHMYGGMTYLPSIKKLFVAGAAPYRGGTGSVGGGTFIDAETGHWDESGAVVGSMLSTDVDSVRVPLVHVVDSSLNPTGEVLTDCVFRRTSQATLLVDPVNKTRQQTVRYWGAAFSRKSYGTVVPDPVYPGRLAYVNDRTATTFACAHRIDIKRNDGSHHNDIEAIAYGNTKPAGVPSDGSGTRWIYMGDFIPGCTQIAVFVEGVGLFSLDTNGWIWSGPHAGPPSGSHVHDAGIMKRIEFFSDYDCFGAFDINGDALYVLKRPSIFSAA